jgi:hypothetical protein
MGTADKIADYFYVLDRVLERNETPSKPRQETAVDSEPPPFTGAEVERSLEAQEAYEQLQQPESVAEQGKQHEPRKLSKDEAKRLHIRLSEIGFPQNKHYELAQFRFKRPFTSLTGLNIAESIELVRYAEEQFKKRQQAA